MEATNYVHGDVAAPSVYEIRLSNGRVIETRVEHGASVSELEKIAQENEVPWAECESVSGFYSWCLGRSTSAEAEAH